MKYLIITTLLLAICGCNNITYSPKDQETEVEGKEGLEVSKQEAIDLANNHLKQIKQDLSKHAQSSVRLVESSSWEKGEHWIVTWSLKTPSDGGQIFVLVNMQKGIRVVKGM